MADPEFTEDSNHPYLRPSYPVTPSLPHSGEEMLVTLRNDDITAINNNTNYRSSFDEDTNPNEDDIWVYNGNQWTPVDPSVINKITLIAGENLTSKKIAAVNDSGKAIHADNTTSSHKTRIIGVIDIGVNTDEEVNIYIGGEIENTGWSWTLGTPVFLSTSGDLTQTPPTTGFSLVIGIPIASNKILIQIGMPVVLV